MVTKGHRNRNNARLIENDRRPAARFLDEIRHNVAGRFRFRTGDGLDPDGVFLRNRDKRVIAIQKVTRINSNLRIGS